MNYKKKYLKYKLKYLKLKKLSGGSITEEEIMECAQESDQDHNKQEMINAVEDAIYDINTSIEQLRKRNILNKTLEDNIEEMITNLKRYDITQEYSDKLKNAIRQYHGVNKANELISKLTIINENEDNDEQTLPFTRPRSPTSDRMRPTIPENEPKNQPENQSTCENVCNIM